MYTTNASSSKPMPSGRNGGIELKRKNSSIVGNGALKAKVPLISNFSKIS